MKAIMILLVALDEGVFPMWELDIVQRLLARGAVHVSILQCPGDPDRSPPLFRWLTKKIPALRTSVLPAEWGGLRWDGAAPDVVLDLRYGDGAALPPPVPADVPRLRFHSSCHSLGIEPLPFVAEVAQSRRTTQVALVLERGGNPPRVVSQGRWRTGAERFPGFVQRVLEDIASWPAAVLPALSVVSPDALAGPAVPAALARAPRRAPAGSAGLAWGIAVSIVRRAFRDLFRHEQWTIGIVAAPIQRFLVDDLVPDIRWRDDRRRHTYLADPFGAIVGSKCTILAERFDYRVGDGDIVRVNFDLEGGWGSEQRVFAVPGHLSYPYLLEEEGKWYAIPESSEFNRVALYELDAELGGWRGITTIVDDFPAVDGTVFRWQSRWWLLATSKATGPDSHLYAWFADRLMGPWSPHPGNPVKIDIGSARPGGTPFVHEGALYRPAQDCSETYGGAVVLLEVVRLDPEAFEERVVRRLAPVPGTRWSRGLHTLSRVGDSFTVADAKREVFSLAAAVMNVRRMLAKGLRRR